MTTPRRANARRVASHLATPIPGQKGNRYAPLRTAFPAKGPSGPAIGFGISTEAAYHGYLRPDRGRRESLAHLRVGMFTRYLCLAVIGGSIAWTTATVRADPPPQGVSMVDRMIQRWHSWWGIKPKMKSRRTYIGGDG